MARTGARTELAFQEETSRGNEEQEQLSGLGETAGKAQRDIGRYHIFSPVTYSSDHPISKEYCLIRGDSQQTVRNDQGYGKFLT